MSKAQVTTLIWLLLPSQKQGCLYNRAKELNKKDKYGKVKNTINKFINQAAIARVLIDTDVGQDTELVLRRVKTTSMQMKKL